MSSRDRYQCERSPDHSVLAHLRGERTLDRVRRLAAQVGGRFTGRTELAPLRHRRAGDLRGLSAWGPGAPYLI
ncbi:MULTISPECIES: hypothetical protein [Streptomyces]|uniref:hypothetical protein n=1 Tax=Streptomyces herbicida TaxID=3065675 RepID=UPI00292EA9FF|nr:hypothetical protein [Streptomyces sp. NEAU-HV9]